jgi:hypothetical protein
MRKRRWIPAPADIGELDGTFFFECPDDHVFVPHSGVKSDHAPSGQSKHKAYEGQKQKH